MNRFTAVLSTFFLFTLLATSPALGQPGRGGMMAPSDSMAGPRMGMMQGGMMGPGMMQMMQGMRQQMMQSPMHRVSMMAFMLPTLTDTLGLSDQQAEQITRLKSEAMTQRQEHRQQMMTHRQQLMELFQGDDQPSAEAVRQHLTAMAELRASQQAALYETAQQMRRVLTDAQRQMLDGLTPQQQMRMMMTRMPMMDMMQMMRSMRGGMMGGGMMGPGMMNRMQGMPMRHGRMMPQGGMQNMPMQPNRQNQ